MALTPEDVVNKRFQATKFREGYDQDEVDDFLDEVVNELRRLTEDNDDLRQKLSTCERRVGELSRATVARGPCPSPCRCPCPWHPPRCRSPWPPSPRRSPAAASGEAPPGPEAAAGMLALAQKLRDEYVRNGEQQRDRIVGEAREHAQRSCARPRRSSVRRWVRWSRRRSLLERKIDELRAFEREYRSRAEVLPGGAAARARGQNRCRAQPSSAADRGGGRGCPGAVLPARCPPAAPTRGRAETGERLPVPVRRSALRQFGRPVRYAGRAIAAFSAGCGGGVRVSSQLPRTA